MITYQDLSDQINNKIEKITREILLSKISLLDLELDPIFQDLENSINVYNITNYSKIYKKACNLLSQKFEELKRLLASLDNDKQFFEFLKSNPPDSEISQLFTECWVDVLHIDCWSYNFLEYSRDRFCRSKTILTEIEHLEKKLINNEFLLEIPKHIFTEKMMRYFEKIKEKLPCKFNDIFDENDQIEIYENFVYVLHLLQLGKIKYQKDTESLYL